jgi:putative ABC transport system substrate-binding protein
VRRRAFIAALGGAAVWPVVARAQQARKMPVIGFLTPGRADNSDASSRTFNAFAPALRELGYVEGQNIVIERKFGDGDAGRLDGLATELVERDVDAIVALSTPAARAANRATTTIPIVAIGMADPVGDGLVVSLAHPGGNVTGTSFLGPELVAKRVQLLKEIVPALSRLAVLWHPHAYSDHTMAGMLKETESAALSLGIKLQFFPAAGADDLSGAFDAMTIDRVDACIVFPSPILFGAYPRIAEFAARNRLPAMYAAREGVEVGGLVSYGASLVDLSRGTAIYLEKILKGAKPADLPVQQPTKFELVINLKTAKALGLDVPPSLLARADEVIE